MRTLKQKISTTISFLAIAALVATLGNACSGGFSPFGGSSGGSGSDNAFGVCAGDGVEITINENTQTAAITHGEQVLETMVSCTQLATEIPETTTLYPSEKTLAEVESRKGSLSEDGAVDSLNPPMAMAYAAIAVEVCDDLYSKESNQSSINRNIFNAIDTTGSTTPDASAIDETLRRMARSCWQRNETSEELNVVRTQIQNIIQSGSSGAQLNRHVGISVCTAVLASLDGFKM